MKEHRIVASNAPVTTIKVAGRPHHYFHSEKLGKVRAIRIAENENLAPGSKHYATPPLSKGEQLEMLMDCGERLHKRYWSLCDEYNALPESARKARKELFARMERVYQGQKRVARKIGLLFTESS
jgi:hypothetical protein